MGNGLPDEMASADVMLAFVGEIAALLTAQFSCDDMRAVYRMQLSSSVNMDAVKGYNRELYALFREVLEKGIRRQEFRSELPPEVLARHFVMAIRGLTYEWCIRYPDFDFQKEACEHFRLLLEGIRG